MTDDWASKIRESMDRSQQAMDLYNRQTQAGMMNYRSGGTTRYTATTGGSTLDLPAFQAAPQPNRSRYRYTPQNAPASSTPFSGAPLESASLYGSGQVNEIGAPPQPQQRQRRPVRQNFMPPNPRQRFTA
jgi:hypothetical protein